MDFARVAVAGAVLAWSAVAGATGPADRTDACAAAFSAAPDLARAGRLLEARSALIRCASESCPARMRPVCAVDLRSVETQLPSVVFVAKTSSGDDVLDATVVEDGHPVADRVDGTAVPLDPGPHRFRFERPDGSSVQVSALLREGEKARPLTAVFGAAGPAEQPATTPSTSKPVPWTVWATGGLALAATGTFAFFGVRGIQQRANLSCEGSCSAAQVQPVRDDYLVANISLAVAAVAAGVALTLYVIRPAVAIELAGPGVLVRGGF